MFDYLLKFIIVGDSGVGKSCLVSRFVENKFVACHEMTIGVEFNTKCMTIGDKKIKIQLWDTAGQEHFKSITRAYYKGSSGVLLCYDITSRDSFAHVEKWLISVKEETTRPEILLVGNKSDLKDRRQVSFEEGEDLAKRYGMMFLEASAKNADHVEQCFTDLTNKIYKNLPADCSKGTSEYSAGITYKPSLSQDTIPYDRSDCCVIL